MHFSGAKLMQSYRKYKPCYLKTEIYNLLRAASKLSEKLVGRGYMVRYV